MPEIVRVVGLYDTPVGRPLTDDMVVTTLFPASSNSLSLLSAKFTTTGAIGLRAPVVTSEVCVIVGAFVSLYV